MGIRESLKSLLVVDGVGVKMNSDARRAFVPNDERWLGLARPPFKVSHSLSEDVIPTGRRSKIERQTWTKLSRCQGRFPPRNQRSFPTRNVR
jgi:hypothetical protein